MTLVNEQRKKKKYKSPYKKGGHNRVNKDGNNKIPNKSKNRINL